MIDMWTVFLELMQTYIHMLRAISFLASSREGTASVLIGELDEQIVVFCCWLKRFEEENLARPEDEKMRDAFHDLFMSHVRALKTITFLVRMGRYGDPEKVRKLEECISILHYWAGKIETEAKLYPDDLSAMILIVRDAREVVKELEQEVQDGR